MPNLLRIVILVEEAEGEMSCWQGQLLRGIEQLSKHDTQKALSCFQKALEDCPADQGAGLSKIFFYMGVTLKKLGMDASALRSWSIGRRLDPKGHAGKMFKRYANGYGMQKQTTTVLDDWKAFYSVHLERYIQTKRSGRIGTAAEKDMILDLIFDYWTDLTHTGALCGKSPLEKMVIFRKVKIVFPFFVVPKRIEERVIPVHFSKKKRLSAGDPCFCGSNLPYFLCCGRASGEEELLRDSI